MSLHVQYSILQTDITWTQTAAVQQWKKVTLTKIFSFKHTENSVTPFCSWNITARNYIHYIEKQCALENKMGLIVISDILKV